MKKNNFDAFKNQLTRSDMKKIMAGSSSCSDGTTNTLICQVHTGEVFEYCYCGASGDPYAACASRLWGYWIQNASWAISLECVTWCHSYCSA
jgi:hypothetical protein